MREFLAFTITTVFVFALILYIGSKVKKRSRYERSPKNVREASDWQKLDRGIDPSE